MTALLAVVADLGAAAAVAARAGPLSAASQARVARIHAPRRRSQSALGRQLAALAASRLLGRDVPAGSVTELDGDGGPQVGELPDLRISIAHSHERVVVAVGPLPLGVDVEWCAGGRDCLALARHAYSATELAWLEGAAPDECTARFYLLWTLREAAYKAGLRAAAQGGASCLDPASGRAPFCWGSREVDGYRLSVVTPEPAAVEWLVMADTRLAPLGRPPFETLGPRGGTPA